MVHFYHVLTIGASGMALYIWTNGETWVVAESANEALLLAADAMGYTDPAQYQKDTDDMPADWVSIPADEDLTIDIEDEGKVTKSAGQWASERGRGWLCSREG
jgi:hypothetical protein